MTLSLRHLLVRTIVAFTAVTAVVGLTAGPASAAETTTVAASSAPSYRAKAPFTTSDREYIRFGASWSRSYEVERVCITANYSGNGFIPGGPITTRCWDHKWSSGSLYLDVSCSFYGGVWSYVNWYDGSGNRLAYRESPESIFVC